MALHFSHRLAGGILFFLLLKKHTFENMQRDILYVALYFFCII